MNASGWRARWLPRVSAAGACLAWAALGIQLAIIFAARIEQGLGLWGGLGNFLGYFTVLTNTLVAFVWTASALPGERAWLKFFRHPQVVAGIVASIVLVGITYSVVLRQLWQPRGWQLVADRLLHDVIPLAFVVYWWLFVERVGLRWREAVWWMLYPLAYLVYALLRGALIDQYPYPFLDVGQLGYRGVAQSALIVLGVFITIVAIVIVLDRLKPAERNVTPID